jgi:hypothetical protein
MMYVLQPIQRPVLRSKQFSGAKYHDSSRERNRLCIEASVASSSGRQAQI